MISLYVPGTTSQVNAAHSKLKDELAQLSNIKQKETAKLAGSGLKSILGQVKQAKFPKNGLAFFAGYDAGGKMQCTIVEPLQPIQTLFFRSWKHFILDKLERQLQLGPVVGVAVYDTKSLVLGEIQGNRRDMLLKQTYQVQNKHRRGGQSAPRFQHQRV